MLSLEARVRVVADVTGALVQIHDNTGVPRQHRRHGRVTPRHLLVGVDGSASLFNTKEPFSKLLPPQPDLGYLAPELLTQSGPANQQSDVFSLGVLLWEALDNGRLFPHRRAAAISRLIARRSLPVPRIEEEWALPLGDVAIKALAYDPAERYADATAFWLALREHLPPPDNARAALARLAQRALKLEMTAEIRDAPPYLVPSSFLIGQSLPPGSGSLPDASVPGENSARYSMRPELSSRAPGSASMRPSPIDSLRPAPEASASSMGGDAGAARDASQPPIAARPASGSQRPFSIGPSSVAPRAEPSYERAPGYAPSSSHPPISTLHVNLPRDLVDTSLPFYVSSQPAARAFPWAALSFAALIFFGVGAAVAFGAVTALRTVPRGAPEASLERAAPPRQAPPTAVEAQNIQAAQPSVAAAAPTAELPSPIAQPAAEAQAAPALAHVPETAAADPTRDAVLVPASATKDELERQRRTPRHVAKPARPKRPVPKAAGPATTAAPAPATAPAPAAPVDAAQPPDEGLPFVEQPY